MCTIIIGKPYHFITRFFLGGYIYVSMKFPQVLVSFMQMPSIREDEQIGHTSISSGNDQETEGELMGICGT